MTEIYRKSWRKLIVTLVITGVVFLWGLNSSLTENLYSNTLYPVISVTLRTISSIFPFPLGDVLYLLLVVYIIRSIYIFSKNLFKKKLNKTHRLLVPLQVLNFTLILYIAFKLLWGLNYSRPSVSSNLGISNKKYSEKELVFLAELLINKINHLESLKKTHPLIKKRQYTIIELQARATKAYYKMSQEQAFFRYRSPVVKPVLNSWLITKIGLEGYYNPLSGEANVNMRLPQEDLPFITCHEIAHQIAVAREDEANLIAYLVATNSTDLNFQYSGYYAILRNVLFEVRLIAPQHYEALYKSINLATLQEYKNGMAFWQKYNNEMFGYMSATLDGFLKINNQYKGVDSYQDIVLWVYNVHEKEIREKHYSLKTKIP
ncbi:hypothetical protein AAKU52_001719 [Pedobacter sp. CG_S7]|uniref:DUF3810 domain-containing protein n=1 Tax=Pedobacter sp. CG_S7 TaxID=3143930 RepID=UPI003396E5CC